MPWDFVLLYIHTYIHTYIHKYISIIYFWFFCLPLFLVQKMVPWPEFERDYLCYFSSLSIFFLLPPALPPIFLYSPLSTYYTLPVFWVWSLLWLSDIAYTLLGCINVHTNQPPWDWPITRLYIQDKWCQWAWSTAPLYWACCKFSAT